jgi:DNA helicase-2/ATP-dependent DNA helicase PcrA
MLKLLDRDGSTNVAARVKALAEEAGLLPSIPDKLGERELTRQSDLARLVRLAAEFEASQQADGQQNCAAFAADLRRRFDPGGQAARGVHLLTYHRAKGLEFDAVFLPRLEEKELPWKLARTPDERAEERRLFYVGLTRARHALAVTWSKRPSPFLAELGIDAYPAAVAPAARGSRDESPAADVLRRWRRQRADSDGVPAYVIFPDRTLDEILARRPATAGELAAIHGLGATRLERFGRELWAAVKEALNIASDAPPRELPPRESLAPVPPVDAPVEADLYDALAAWRRSRSQSDEVPAFQVFPNRVLEAIAEARPGSREELAEVWGVGPTKIERYGDEVLRVVAAA